MPTAIQTFFENYADAQRANSAKNIAAFYQTPLTIYSDDGIQQITKMTDVVKFWKQSVKSYKDKGVERTVATVLSQEQFSKTIVISKVLWENFGPDDKEISKETNIYILIESNSELKISGSIIMAI